MNPIDWLCAKAPGFSDLSENERAAIMHFSLLWSFFEAEALHTNASAKSILALVHEWASNDRLNIAPFATSLAYFRDRYFNQGTFTEHFRGLNLRRNDSPDLVCAVLKGENTNDADSVSVLLIIVFRLRNNLFHGVKWAYGIRGQLDNFTNANAALMAALETHGHL
jgi:hypothetical protein